MRAILRRRARLKRQPRRIPVVCLTQWLEVSQRECREQVKELTHLQNQGSKLCLAIVGPPKMRGHLLEGKQIAAINHVEMAEGLASLQAAVS
jgi:hypothetical protein